MTRKEAIKILDTIPTIGEQVDALEMAIKSLEAWDNIAQEILEAGYKGEEVRFRLCGRAFAVRELAQ